MSQIPYEDGEYTIKKWYWDRYEGHHLLFNGHTLCTYTNWDEDRVIADAKIMIEKHRGMGKRDDEIQQRRRQGGDQCSPEQADSAGLVDAPQVGEAYSGQVPEQCGSMQLPE
jgi:hypothetical protein